MYNNSRAAFPAREFYLNIEREFPHEKAFCTDFVPGAVRRTAGGCGASASTAASSEAVSSEVVSEAVSEEAVSTAEAADSAEAIQFTFTVTGADGESTVLTLDAADGEKLSTALADAGVISAEEAEAGFVTVVNGEAADYNKDGSWWCLTDAAGEMTSVGVADIELHDGDSYAFTYTK